MARTGEDLLEYRRHPLWTKFIDFITRHPLGAIYDIHPDNKVMLFEVFAGGGVAAKERCKKIASDIGYNKTLDVVGGEADVFDIYKLIEERIEREL